MRYTTQILSTTKGFERTLLVCEIEHHEISENRPKNGVLSHNSDELGQDFKPLYLEDQESSDHILGRGGGVDKRELTDGGILT